jgi:hypothetical protein
MIIGNIIKGLNKDPVFDFMPYKVHKICNHSNIDVITTSEQYDFCFDVISDNLYKKYKDCVCYDDLLQINYMFCKLKLFYDLCVYNPNVWFTDPTTISGKLKYYTNMSYRCFLEKIVLINKWKNLAKKYIKDKKSVVNFICVTNKIRESINKKYR